MKNIYIVLALLLMGFSDMSFANRLDGDIVRSRCAAKELTQTQCAQLRNIAYNNGAGCITKAEYDYANIKKLAPMCNILNPTELFAVCTCGCFQEGTKIDAFNLAFAGDQQVNIEDIVRGAAAQQAAANFEVYAVTGDSRRSLLDYEPRSVSVVTEGEESKPLVLITTESGKTVGLSRQHGVLLANGKMIIAGNLKKHHKLLNKEGTVERIASIKEGPVGEVVYNLMTDAETENGHLVVANGLVLGDLYWQNILESEMARFRIRR